MSDHPSYVAGYFYPKEPEEISKVITLLLTQVPKITYVPKAMICPHAGYIYSGLTAAHAYAALQNPNKIKNVVLLGPAHRCYFTGVATSNAANFTTPLGKIPVNNILTKVATVAGAQIFEKAFINEHCLEVQLPFLQKLLTNFTIVPLIIGQAAYSLVTTIINALWEEPDTLIIVSSDLSHYHTYPIAKTLDENTNDLILNLEPAKLSHDRACGATPIQGLLQSAKEHKMQLKLLDMRNSGDTAGDKNRVVGYASYHVVPYA